jgi:hypothetical protein
MNEKNLIVIACDLVFALITDLSMGSQYLDKR